MGRTSIPLALIAPKGYAFSDGAPWSVELSTDRVGLTATALSGEAKAGERIALSLDADVPVGAAQLTAQVHANICDAVNHAACYPVRARYAIALDGSVAAATESEIALPLTAPARR